MTHPLPSLVLPETAEGWQRWYRRLLGADGALDSSRVEKWLERMSVATYVAEGGALDADATDLEIALATLRGAVAQVCGRELQADTERLKRERGRQ